ncbi:hypothetical protein DFH29DRAFT_122704 [Suillus ampliporus]|nr:hypothetical protein DFH29DRAFT_122704 [Suillus ampliporus]
MPTPLAIQAHLDSGKARTFFCSSNDARSSSSRALGKNRPTTSCDIVSTGIHRWKSGSLQNQQGLNNSSSILSDERIHLKYDGSFLIRLASIYPTHNLGVPEFLQLQSKYFALRMCSDKVFHRQTPLSPPRYTATSESRRPLSQHNWCVRTPPELQVLMSAISPAHTIPHVFQVQLMSSELCMTHVRRGLTVVDARRIVSRDSSIPSVSSVLTRYCSLKC